MTKSAQSRVTHGRATPFDTRVAAVCRVLLGESVTAVCADLGCARATFYTWRRDVRVLGAAQLQADLATAPKPEPKPAPEPSAPAEPKRKKRGRTSPIEDDAKRERFLTGVRLGLPWSSLAATIGVHPTTLRNWLDQAESGEGPAAEWGVEILAARAEGEIILAERVAEGDSGWQGAAWILARRNEEWRERTIQTVETRATGLDELSEEELTALLAATTKN